MKGQSKRKESELGNAKAIAITALVMLLAAMGNLIAGAISAAAQNEPGPPDNVTVNASSRRVESVQGFTVPAQAGNVSQLIINDTRVTTHWQGYYGRITGVITLDDGKNNTLFDWQLTNPVGEIFASNSSSVNWGNITCVNLTSNISGSGTRSKLNASILEDTFNISYTDADGINETFNYTFTDSLTVGETIIASSYNCPLVYLYTNNAAQQADFQEVLLTDNTSVIFTAPLENDLSGFEGSPWDFQMIVPENRAAGTTDYYLFVELS